MPPRTRTIVALYRPDHVSGINATARRMASLPEPWHPLICGPDLDPAARTMPGFGDIPVSIATWPAAADPVTQSLAVLDAIVRLNATIVVPNDIPHGFIAAALAPGCRAAAWIHADGLDGDELVERCGWLASSWRPVSRSVLRRASAIGALPALHTDEHVPCPVDVPDRAPQPPALALGAPIRLLYAGRLERFNKRVMDLVALCDALVAMGAPFHLSIAGRGPAEAEFTGRMCPHVDAGRVTILGPVDAMRMRTLYADSHALVLVSRSEGTPVVAMEAMAAARPVIATDRCGGVVETLHTRRCGVVTPVGDMHAMAAAIASLTPAALYDMGERAHAAARDLYSIDALAPAITRWMDETAAAPAPISVADSSSVCARWASVLRAVEAIGPCSESSLRALATRYLGALGLPQMAGALATWLPGEPGPRERHFTRAIDLLRSRGARRIALYGAGAHTSALARAIAQRPEIVAIADDRAHQPGAPASLAGLPVVTPNELNGLGVDAVVISSDEHEQSMLRRALAWREQGVCDASIVPLYNLPPTIGYDASRDLALADRLTPVATLEARPTQATRRAG